MDAAKFIEERNRMCKSFDVRCEVCPAFHDSENGARCGVGAASTLDATDQIAIVGEWSAAHPRKTRQSVFLEQWPNAKVFVDGVLDFCPRELDKCHQCQSTDIEMHCQSCRREFWMQEVE